jgi:hypothetical protein
VSSDFPAGRSSTIDLFRPAETSSPSLSAERARLLLEAFKNSTGHGDNKGICRWCLKHFDPYTAKPRTTWERGQLRTRLKMADNGSELVICDGCWDSVYYPYFTMGGVPQKSDPEHVPLLLRTLEP